MRHACSPQPWSHALPEHRINCFGRHLSETLHEQGLWLNGNPVGIAKVGRKVYIVNTRPGETRGGKPWLYFVVEGENWEWCGTGPLYMMLTVGSAPSGYKNLARWDKKAEGMEVGRAGDFSTPSTKGEMVLWA